MYILLTILIIFVRLSHIQYHRCYKVDVDFYYDDDKEELP